MDYPLIQYGCNRFGALTLVMDVSERLPEGWVRVSGHTHYCPLCAKEMGMEESNP